MRTIEDVTSELFGRGSLPVRLRVVRQFGAFRPGTEIAWSDALRCYQDATGTWCLEAWQARHGLGVAFFPALEHHTQPSLFDGVAA